MYTNRKRGQFTSSTYSRHRQTPNHLKRLMPTPFGVNSSLVLDGFLNLAILEYKNQRWMFKSYMSEFYFIPCP